MDSCELFTNLNDDMSKLRNQWDSLKTLFAKYCYSTDLSESEKATLVKSIHEKRQQIIQIGSIIQENIIRGIYPEITNYGCVGVSVEKSTKAEIDAAIKFVLEVNNTIVMHN